MPNSDIDINIQLDNIATGKLRVYADNDPNLPSTYAPDALNLRETGGTASNFITSNGTRVVLFNYSQKHFTSASFFALGRVALNEGVQLFRHESVGTGEATRYAEVGGWLAQAHNILQNANRMNFDKTGIGTSARNILCLSLGNGVVYDSTYQMNQWLNAPNAKIAPVNPPTLEKIAYANYGLNNRLDPNQPMGDKEYQYLKAKGFTLPNGPFWTPLNVHQMAIEIEQSMRYAPEYLQQYYYKFVKG